MKFDEAINYIAENLTPVASEMAKPKNPFIVQRAAELEKQGLSPATAYAYARKEFLKQQASGDTAPVAPSAPVTPSEPIASAPSTGSVSFRELPDTLATRAKVAEIFAADPQVSDEDVISRIAADAESGEALNTDDELIKQELSMLRSNSGGEEVSEPSAAELKKSELASKYDRMRQALYRARGLKAKTGRKSGSKEEPDNEDEEDYSSGNRSINMRDEPIDPNEL